MAKTRAERREEIAVRMMVAAMRKRSYCNAHDQANDAVAMANAPDIAVQFVHVCRE